MTLTEIIRADALYLTNVRVECDSRYSTVEIGDDIFLQGQEADEFNDKVERLWNLTGDTTKDECAKHLAKPYVDCLS